MHYCVVLVVFQKSTTVKNVWQKVYVMLIEKEIVDTVSNNGYKRKVRGRMIFNAIKMGFIIWIYSAFISLSLVTLSMAVMLVIFEWKEEIGK